MIAFAMAASVMVTLMFALAFIVSTARDGALSLIHAHLADIKQLSGAIILLVGVGFITQAIFAGAIDALLPFR